MGGQGVVMVVVVVVVWLLQAAESTGQQNGRKNGDFK
jgi:hypothetical protein